MEAATERKTNIKKVVFFDFFFNVGFPLLKKCLTSIFPNLIAAPVFYSI
jgi:hypothetical protein